MQKKISVTLYKSAPDANVKLAIKCNGAAYTLLRQEFPNSGEAFAPNLALYIQAEIIGNQFIADFKDAETAKKFYDSIASNPNLTLVLQDSKVGIVDEKLCNEPASARYNIKAELDFSKHHALDTVTTTAMNLNNPTTTTTTTTTTTNTLAVATNNPTTAVTTTTLTANTNTLQVTLYKSRNNQLSVKCDNQKDYLCLKKEYPKEEFPELVFLDQNLTMYIPAKVDGDSLVAEFGGVHSQKAAEKFCKSISSYENVSLTIQDSVKIRVSDPLLCNPPPNTAQYNIRATLSFPLQQIPTLPNENLVHFANPFPAFAHTNVQPNTAPVVAQNTSTKKVIAFDIQGTLLIRELRRRENATADNWVIDQWIMQNELINNLKSLENDNEYIIAVVPSFPITQQEYETFKDIFQKNQLEKCLASLEEIYGLQDLKEKIDVLNYYCTKECSGDKEKIQYFDDLESNVKDAQKNGFTNSHHVPNVNQLITQLEPLCKAETLGNDSDLNHMKIYSLELGKYPTPINLIANGTYKELTFPDMHGRFKKFFILLLLNDIISTSKENHAKVNMICDTSVEGIEDSHIKTLETILLSVEVRHRPRLLRLAGDLVVERGENDLFMLLGLQMLDIKMILSEILVSNHDIELIKAYEKNNGYKPTALTGGHAQSLYNLRRLIERKKITKEFVDGLVKNHHINKLKLLSYSLHPSGKSITIFTHAPIHARGLAIIQNIALRLNALYKDDTAKDLGDSIDRIHVKFIEYKRAGKISELFPDMALHQGYRSEMGYTGNDPFVYLIWCRVVEVPDTAPPIDKPYDINFCFGHTRYESHTAKPKNIFPIDDRNRLGHSGYDSTEPQECTILYSNEISPVLVQEQTNDPNGTQANNAETITPTFNNF